MTGKLYKSRNGTEHVVKVIGKHREMLKGEKLDNTAHTYQVLAQRQKSIYGYGEITSFMGQILAEDDVFFKPFSMEEELFLSEYEVLNETPTN